MTHTRLRGVILAAGLAALMPPHGEALASVVEIHKYSVNDAAPVDNFGYSIAATQSTVVVGSRLDDDGGTDSGSAYLFDATSGNQTAKLTANDAGSHDRFGSSVAISGNTVVVAAHLDDTIEYGGSSGSVYLFDATSGNQTAKLIPDDGAAGDQFGQSVAISGNTVAIGSRLDDDNGNNSGSAYLFNATTGNQTTKLLADDGEANDMFGWSVAISGNTVAVGALLDDDNGSDSGAVYLFDATTGLQTAKLTADDGAAGDEFGYSVAISGNTVVVGARRDDDSGTDSGAVYLFDASSGLQTAKLAAADAAAGDQFGYSVAINGDHVVIGSREDDGGSPDAGSVYLFDALSGAQIEQFVASDAAEDDNLGTSVAIAGGQIFAGASGADSAAAVSSGAAYAFDNPLLGVSVPASLPLLAVGLLIPVLLRRRG